MVFSTLAPVLFLSLFLTALLFSFLLPSIENSYFQQKKELINKKKRLTVVNLFSICGDYRTRTGHLDTASVAL